MSELRLPRLAHEIAEKGRINDDDVARLRACLCPGGALGPADAEILLWLNHACRHVCRTWTEFFAGALSEYVVLAVEPAGYVDPAGAERLADRVLRRGRIATASELELIAAVVAKARAVPACLVLFALGEVRLSVIEGEGPLRRDLELGPGAIAEAEVDLLGRVLGGYAGKGHTRIGRAEAEVLFDLNRGVAGGPGKTAWADLFVAAMASYATGAVNVKAPATAEPRHLKGWNRYLADDEVDLDRAFAEEEARWLAGRMRRYWALDANERALLDRLKREAPAMPTSLQHLIERAA